jgi:hypothetical protein
MRTVKKSEIPEAVTNPGVPCMRKNFELNAGHCLGGKIAQKAL